LTNFNISVNVTDDFLAAVDDKRWFQLSFDGKPWDQPVHDPVTGTDYAVYYLKGQNDSPVTFCDRAAFEAYQDTPTQAGQLVKVPAPQPGMVYAPDIWNRI